MNMDKTTSKKYCVLVDPYIASQELCDQLLKNDFGLIAVTTDMVAFTEEEKKQRFPADKIEFTFHYTCNNWEDLIKYLKSYSIEYVIAGKSSFL